MNLDILNKEQKEAVLYNDGPLLIIAGAGSGKTRVITYKIAYLIENGVSPSNILAITFTNKAANEMKERVEKLVENTAKSVFVSTFHKFCGKVLRVFIETIGYNRNYTIYDTDDQKRLMKKIIKDLGFDEKKIKEKAVLSKISYCKNHNISVDEYNKSGHSDTEKIYAKLFREYEDRMFKSNAIDFDDMLLLTVKILKENENARVSLANKFKYILVDEYQDTNLVQFEIIRLLTKDKNNYLTVVGDDDQSIYKFRGADISNILSFEENFAGAKTIKLTQNYRSTNSILSIANSVIKNNQGRKDKNLWSENGSGEKVVFTEYADDSEEAYKIITKIKNDNDYKNTAILYRTNAQSRKFEEMCVSLSIPYIIIGGVNFYDRKEVRDVIAYLSFTLNDKDDSALMRIINVPKRGIGDTTMEKVLEFAREKDISVYEALKLSDSIDIKEKAKNSIKGFIKLIETLKDENEIDILIDKILKNGYEDYLYEEYDKEEASDRINNIIELKNKAITFKNVYSSYIEDDMMSEFAKNNSAKSILSDFLYEISLVADTDNIDDKLNALTLMSLHSSKGLEYDTIYLTGINEGVFPSYQSVTSDDPSDIEEERRLMYVGVTRAKKHLFLSSALRRMQNGSYNSFNVSRFIDEIDSDSIVKNRLNRSSILDREFGDRDYGKREFTFSKRKVYNDFGFEKNRKVTSFAKVSKEDLKKTIDTYKTGENIIKATNLEYKVADRVSHIKFGEGTVLKIEDIGRDYEVTVEFDEYGKKTLFAAFAKLEKM